MALPDPVYATQTDFEDAIEGWETTDEDALNRLLARAERDIDAVFPLLPIITTGTYAGRRFDPTRLRPYQARALAEATCLQAYHRHRTAPAGAEPVRRVKREKGPDFEQEFADSETAGTGRYHPELDLALAPLNVYRARGARARA